MKEFIKFSKTFKGNPTLVFHYDSGKYATDIVVETTSTYSNAKVTVGDTDSNVLVAEFFADNFGNFSKSGLLNAIVKNRIKNDPALRKLFSTARYLSEEIYYPDGKDHRGNWRGEPKTSIVKKYAFEGFEETNESSPSASETVDEKKDNE